MINNVKKIKEYKDFKKVIEVFKEPPFSEILTDKDMYNEFVSYALEGVSYGYYEGDKILGFIGILKGIQDNHPIVGYKSDKMLYINGIAVLEKYRKKGIGSKLMNYTLAKINPHEYNSIYLRTNYVGSKIEKVALTAGFEKVTKNGIVVTEDVVFERNTGEVGTDKRMFMVKKLIK